MDFSDLVATKLKELMKENDITTYKLQDLTGIYNSTISQFLTRKTKTIRLEILFIICEAICIFRYSLRTAALFQPGGFN